MQYMLLVHVDESLIGKLTPEEGKANSRECFEYDRELERRGKYVASNPLMGPDTATVVRMREGKLSMHDGPHVETKEHLGGFILVEARDLNEALDIAANCPMAKFGSIEVRAEMSLEVEERAP
ncbi:MAG TPA: YciI family protein [Devosia sp.]|nr:YciI family protein [Devosia sp.]